LHSPLILGNFEAKRRNLFEHGNALLSGGSFPARVKFKGNERKCHGMS
jgi:hypothetical protein